MADAPAEIGRGGRVDSERSPIALRARGVSKRYGRAGPLALDSVNLEIPAGSITALVGPNGAGKSTLLRSWMGFEQPSRGRMAVNGWDVARNRDQAVAACGYVPQGSALYSRLSVADHVAFVSRLRPSFDVDVAQRRLAALQIDTERHVGMLSGGQRAQVMLALVIASRPAVLLLDEPLASLDPLARRGFLNVLAQEARDTRATVLLSSHIVTDIQSVCDSLIVLSGGRITLHERIDVTLGQFAVLDGSVESTAALSTFADADGSVIQLVSASVAAARPATLEEIVLGHLAMGIASEVASAR